MAPTCWLVIWVTAFVVTGCRDCHECRIFGHDGSLDVRGLLLFGVLPLSRVQVFHVKKKWRIFYQSLYVPIFMMTYIPATVAALFKRLSGFLLNM